MLLLTLRDLLCLLTGNLRLPEGGIMLNSTTRYLATIVGLRIASLSVIRISCYTVSAGLGDVSTNGRCFSQIS